MPRGWRRGGACCSRCRAGRRQRRGGEAETRRAEAVHGQGYVIDGDAIGVGEARVRLSAWSAVMKRLLQSNSHLLGLAGGRLVTVHPVDIDCYGRIVARVRLGEIDLSGSMVCRWLRPCDEGWHVDYMATECRGAAARRGLWPDEAGGIGDPAAHRRPKGADSGAPTGKAVRRSGRPRPRCRRRRRAGARGRRIRP